MQTIFITKNKGKLKTFSCGDGLAFNSVTGVCDWDYNVDGCGTTCNGCGM